MRDALNFFEPFESLPAGHENQITRAFLVVLRMVPMAHASWLRLVNQSRPGTANLPALEELGDTSFETQTGNIGQTTVTEEEIGDEASARRAVSVILAGELASDEPLAESSERRAVFDGVVRYGTDLILIIESKLGGRFSTRQAREIAIRETGWQVEPEVASVRWRDVIAAWRGLLLRDMLTGAERKILEDFMWFVQRHFPHLQPFSELGVCRGDPYLLRLRCQAVLDEILPGAAESQRRSARLTLAGTRTVKFAYLGSDDGLNAESQVRLRMHPGDTLGQAKVLYASRDRIEQILQLRDEGWELVPNFHFGHMAKGFTWTSGPIEVEKYVSHWLAEISEAEQVRREDWPAYFDRLIELGIASDTDREGFDRDFTDTGRGSATPRPGLTIRFSWPFDSAAALDSRGRFSGAVRRAIDKTLYALGEPSLS